MTGKLGRQLLDLTDTRRREVLGRLTKLWQPKPGSQQGALSRRVMDEFLRMARTIHFCLTPLLFLPKWRYQAQATRQRGADGEGADPASSCLDEMATRKIRRHAQDEKDHELLIVDFMQDYIDYLQTGRSAILSKCLYCFRRHVQRWAKFQFPGLANFVPACCLPLLPELALKNYISTWEWYVSPAL